MRTALLLTFLFVARGVEAQQPAPARFAGLTTIAGEVARSPIEARAVIVTSEPNAVRIVAVAIPDETRDCSGTYELVGSTSFTVMGATRGNFSSGNRRVIALSVNVPRGAPAGNASIGALRFRCDDDKVVDVPLIVSVSANRALTLHPVRPLVAASIGGRFRAEVIVRNEGNATERVTISSVLPAGWRSRQFAGATVVVRPASAETAWLDFVIGQAAGTGDYGVVVNAVSTDGTAATTTFTVHVGTGRDGRAEARSFLSTGAMLATDNDGLTTHGFTAELSGAVHPEVQASGRMSYTPDAYEGSWLAARSFNRLGASRNSAYLYLQSSRWQSGFGNIGYPRQDLGGTSLWGVGATGELNVGRSKLSVFGVRPGATLDGDGHFLVADASYLIGPVDAGILAGDLDEGTAGRRAARVLVANFSIPLPDAIAELQLGSMSGTKERGLAWLARLERRTSDWGAGVTSAHAPGGTTSFAPAEDQLMADVYRVFASTLTLSGAYWNSRNGTAAEGSQTSSNRGWSAGPRLRLGPFGVISLNGRSAAFDGGSGIGTFGSTDRRLSVEWSGGRGAIFGRVGASRGEMERESQIGGISLTTKATRSAVFASISGSGRLGQFQLDLDRENTGPGVGAPLRQTTVSLRGDMIPLIPGVVTLYAETFVSFLGVSATRAASQVAGIRTQVTPSLQLRVDAERNGFHHGSVRTPWVIATRLQRTFGVPAFGSPRRPQGIVFGDLNNDGVRGRDERGLPGVLLSLDGRTVITDSRGRFSGGGDPSRAVVDVRSLPPGWVAVTHSGSQTGIREVAVPVVPTSPVEVKLVLVNGPGIDLSRVKVTDAVIVLSDSLGRAWTGAPDKDGLLNFDALPPGVYEVSADLSALGETLILPEVLPQLRVVGGGGLLTAELRVGPRPIRPSPERPRVRRVGVGGAGAGAPDK